MNTPAEGEMVNPPAEEESKKMSKRARWRRNKKKKNLLSEAAEVRDSSAEKEEVHDSSSVKEEVRDSSAEKEDVSLCSLVCDLLFSLPRSSYKSWDEGITREMLVGLKMCAAADWCGLASDTAVTDLRGQSANYAERFLVNHIFCSSEQPELRYLKVRVGCKKHGLGQGKLKKEIIELLNGDDSIKWVEEDNGTVISIELDGSHSQYALGWFSGDREQPLGL